MFQYTSETIINSNAGALINGTARFAILNPDGNKVTSSPADTDDLLVIDGVTAVRVGDIKKIYHTAYADPVLATNVIKVPSTIAADDVVTLRVILSEQGRSSSIMQSAFMHKAKPFTYQVIAPAAVPSGASVVDGAIAKLLKLVADEMAETDFKFFKAGAGAANNEIQITGADCYVRIDSVELEVSHIDATGKEIVTVTKGVTGRIGSEGRGTVAQLVKNLRVPTSAKIDPFEVKDGGMPIPGGKYEQYLIEVETERRHIAGGVVGSVNTSLTSFVLFMEQDGADSDWQTDVIGVLPSAKYIDSTPAAATASADAAPVTAKVPAGVGNIG